MLIRLSSLCILEPEVILPLSWQALVACSRKKWVAMVMLTVFSLWSILNWWGVKYITRSIVCQKVRFWTLLWFCVFAPKWDMALVIELNLHARILRVKWYFIIFFLPKGVTFLIEGLHKRFLLVFYCILIQWWLLGWFRLCHSYGHLVLSSLLIEWTTCFILRRIAIFVCMLLFYAG